MKEYPIIFSGPMVRAILDGRKNQTRVLPTAMWAGAMRQVMLAESVRLWVRETWMPVIDSGQHEACYRADYTGAAVLYMAALQRWRSPIHMPRWASRITLDVVSMRKERLQDISASDCAAEGLEMRQYLWRCEGPNGGEWHTCYTASECYRWLWDKIHRNLGTRWADNPEVYRIEFREGWRRDRHQGPSIKPSGL